MHKFVCVRHKNIILFSACRGVDKFLGLGVVASVQKPTFYQVLKRSTERCKYTAIHHDDLTTEL